MNKTQQQMITIAIKKPPTTNISIAPGQKVVLNSASNQFGPQIQTKKPIISYPNKSLIQPPNMATGSFLSKSASGLPSGQSQIKMMNGSTHSGAYSFTDLISEVILFFYSFSWFMMIFDGKFVFNRCTK